MSGLVIRDLPPELHARLRAEAKRHRRSMTQQALVILEEALVEAAPVRFPNPVKGRHPLTQERLTRAIREGRE